MKVVLFCGGQGCGCARTPRRVRSRWCRSATGPILWHVMKYYAHFGHTDFILCLGYKAEVIKEYFLSYNEAIQRLRAVEGRRGASSC